MDTIVYYICIPLGWLMKVCWQLLGNYGLAIIFFTLLTKVVLLPVSIWIQKNSIQMVKLQPEINMLKVNYYGNPEMMADEQVKLFKREHYHPILTLIPLVLQIVLLLGVVYIIYHPMTYLFGISDQTVNYLAAHLNIDTADSSCQLLIMEAIQNGTLTASQTVTGVESAALLEIVGTVQDFNLRFVGMNLSTIPIETFGWYVLVPIFAGLSSWVMCFTQNLSNVIQHEQGKLNQYGIMAISVALSLYLGLFVPSGIALYWIASNLLSVAQMYLLNVAINPKKYVDYEALEQSRKALEDLKEYTKSDITGEKAKEYKRREKEDYKRFKKIANKHVVIYSEKSGFYKYYKGIIEQLLKRSNLSIHYVTNDPEDIIFEIAKEQPKIKPYYISLKKTMVLMMLVETEMFIMTTPDLDKYYLKRSMIKSDIEYVYVPHDMMSTHMGFREGALDAFDTIFCTGEHVENEVRETEKVYNLKQKTLVRFGYPLADSLEQDAIRAETQDKKSDKREILIAPSWQEDNILDSCIDDIIKALYCDKNHIIVRPHPEYVKRYGVALKKLVERYEGYDKDKLTFELNFQTNKSIYSSDMLITDWSGIAAEFSFATKRPCVFVNTKIKCVNPNYTKIGLVPKEISLRKEIGIDVDKDKVSEIGKIVDELTLNKDSYRSVITEWKNNLIFNHGTAAEKGAEYILSSLSNKKKNKK